MLIDSNVLKSPGTLVYVIVHPDNFDTDLLLLRRGSSRSDSGPLPHVLKPLRGLYLAHFTLIIGKNGNLANAPSSMSFWINESASFKTFRDYAYPRIRYSLQIAAPFPRYSAAI
ncbi:unnamed protein product [Kuraishia capsulata CBS 1993]|uniref:Uncharacterized protein n=1 Tax=Kuraishia capsulata CBS 1993 TaxID=1382522 RepID=W6MND0_9ASCO|nr:uncharacterized protein KUCA_T00004150001 [Kuraishia capsulata CBS 1993]CDK28169.1 unnamed protein product [Kuraishia capsulata CBS 1993]